MCEAPSTAVYHYMLELCALRGDYERALSLHQSMKEQGLPLSDFAHQCLVQAYGWAGKLQNMDQHLADMEAQHVPVTLALITEMIFHHGRLRDVPGAMNVYTKMLEHNLYPDEKLNQVLIHVCRIDPLSVVWNARPEQRAAAKTRRRRAELGTRKIA